MAELSVTPSIGAGLGALDSSRSREVLNKGVGESFRDSLAKATKQPPEILSQSQSQSQSLKFSGHAVDRMKSRGISFSNGDMQAIEKAVSRAAQKGSRDTLVLAGENALIVSVKNNTVVTVMDRAAMRENVFTNIDSTVVL